MAGFSIVVVSGNLTRDPELRYTQSGAAVVDFDVAVNSPFSNEETTYVRCTAFGKTAENTSRYTAKGAAVVVVGRLKQDTWETSEGNKRSRLKILVNNIHFMSKAKKSADDSPTPSVEDDVPF